MAFIIAISNEKGGVAKTTTTLSLGASLSEIGQKVLVIDLDPQANLTLALGFEPNEERTSAGDVLLNSKSLREAINKTDFPDLDLVCSNAEMEHTEQVLLAQLNYKRLLRNAIQQAEPLPYDFILLDCPPSLGSITVNALTVAELLLIPTQAEYFSAYALRDMMSIIRQVRAEENPNLAYRILVTLLDRRNRTHRDILEQLERKFGEGLFTTLIEIDTKLRESPILGLPINHYKPSSRGALQYHLLAEELIEYVQKTYPEKA